MMNEDGKAYFQQVLDDNEQILWVGKPNRLIFLLGGVPFLLIGIIWGIIDFSILGGMFFAKRSMGGPMMFFIIPFFALHLFPFWGSILNMIRLMFVHGNTYYAYTNKRVIMRTGFWGIDYKIVDYDKITDIQVNVNPIENSLGVGTIKMNTGNVSRKGRIAYDEFVGIQEPYEVFKSLKKVSVDIKTDWNYPNALRPEENPGYNTKYDPNNREK